MDRIACTTACALFLTALPTMASTIFSNLGPGDSFDSVGNVLMGQGTASPIPDMAQSFVAAVTDDIFSVEIPLLLFSGTPAELTLHIATDNGGVPGTIQQTQSITALTGAEPVLVTANFGSGTLLTAGNTYWVWLVAGNTATVRWGFTGPVDSAGAALRSTDSGTSWGSPLSGPNLAFRVNGATSLNETPEPGTLILMGFGLLGLGLAKRRTASVSGKNGRV